MNLQLLFSPPFVSALWKHPLSLFTFLSHLAAVTNAQHHRHRRAQQRKRLRLCFSSCRLLSMAGKLNKNQQTSEKVRTSSRRPSDSRHRSHRPITLHHNFKPTTADTSTSSMKSAPPAAAPAMKCGRSILFSLVSPQRTKMSRRVKKQTYSRSSERGGGRSLFRWMHTSRDTIMWPTCPFWSSLRPLHNVWFCKEKGERNVSRTMISCHFKQLCKGQRSDYFSRLYTSTPKHLEVMTVTVISDEATLNLIFILWIFSAITW